MLEIFISIYKMWFSALSLLPLCYSWLAPLLLLCCELIVGLSLVKISSMTLWITLFTTTGSKPFSNSASKSEFVLILSQNASRIYFGLTCQSFHWVNDFSSRFATLATRMEQYIQGQSRDLVDQAYTKFVSASVLHLFSWCITTTIKMWNEQLKMLEWHNICYWFSCLTIFFRMRVLW